MSGLTIANLKRIDRDALYALLKKQSAGPSSPPHVAIVDVRDSDYIGGHIRGCTNVPSSSLDHRMPELVRQLSAVPVVVFHCALSQQRGPSAALGYLRERARLPGSGSQDVRVLEGGFTKWQEKYGEDATVTEGFRRDVWGFGQ